MAKPTRLKYTGTVSDRLDEHGNVVGRQADRWFEGVPARDLDESDLAGMDAATVKNIMGGADPLYVDPDAEKPAAKGAEKGAEKPAEKPAGKDT